MITTTTKLTNDTWVQVINDTETSWILQNVSGHDIVISYSTTAPTNTGDYIILEPKAGLKSDYGIGNIWAKALSAYGGSISVSK
jgi:hypothetical protein